MKEFKAKKGNFWIYILISALFPLLLWLGEDISEDTFVFIGLLLPSFLPFILFIWIYFSTKYYIKDDEFFYRSAFLKGRIEITKITSVQKNKTLWSGTKPAMARKGLIIKYGYDELYVAPEDNEDLIEALLEINDTIIVT